MKAPIVGLAVALPLVWLMPDEASAQSGYRVAGAKKSYRVTRSYVRPTSVRYRYYGRPASVGPNGLCQRDTGTPTGQLNFRNSCDVEEFWRRNMERGSGRR